MTSTTRSIRERSSRHHRPVRPIHNDDEHQVALQTVNRLWNAPAGSAEDDTLQVLVLLVVAYEREQAPIDPPEPLEAIRFRVAQSGLSIGDFAARVGVSEGRLRDVMEGMRPLTLPLIGRLAERAGISADILIRQPLASRANVGQ